VEQAIFLDRDNTLIANDGDLGDPTGVRLLDGVPQGLRALREIGFRLIVVTNQSGVARGRFTEDDVDAVHQRIAQLVDGGAAMRDVIDRFYYCPYHPDAVIDFYKRDHFWRKPQPGMLLQAARDMKLDLSSCWMIGDQSRDIDAGRAAGCRTVLITRDEALASAAQPTVVAPSFRDAVDTILRAAAPKAPPAHAHGSAPLPAASAGPAREAVPSGADGLARALTDLSEELRHQRQRRLEFTGLRAAGAVATLLAILLALLGASQLGTTDAFIKWMVAAIAAELLAITLFLVDGSR